MNRWELMNQAFERFIQKLPPPMVLPVVWLGRHLEKPWVHATPHNDNMWRFGSGPDAIRKMLAAEQKAR